MEPLVLPFQHHTPQMAENVFIAPGAAVVGQVQLGAHSSVWFNATIRGDVNAVTIGSQTNIQDNACLHVTYQKWPLTIGNKVTVGHGAILHGCTLEDLVLVGMGAIVMDGAVVETGAMVAAGAMVTPGKRVKSGELWAGRPAQFMRQLTQEETDYLSWSATHYSRLAEHYRT